MIIILKKDEAKQMSTVRFQSLHLNNVDIVIERDDYLELLSEAEKLNEKKVKSEDLRSLFLN